MVGALSYPMHKFPVGRETRCRGRALSRPGVDGQQEHLRTSRGLPPTGMQRPIRPRLPIQPQPPVPPQIPIQPQLPVLPQLPVPPQLVHLRHHRGRVAHQPPRLDTELDRVLEYIGPPGLRRPELLLAAPGRLRRRSGMGGRRGMGVSFFRSILAQTLWRLLSRPHTRKPLFSTSPNSHISVILSSLLLLSLMAAQRAGQVGPLRPSPPPSPPSPAPPPTWARPPPWAFAPFQLPERLARTRASAQASLMRLTSKWNGST